MSAKPTKSGPPSAKAGVDTGRRVALLMNLNLECCRNLIRGVHAFALEKQDWILRNSPCDPEIIPLLRHWKPDGIIATLFDRKMARALGRLRRPIVDTAFTLHGLNLPVADVDHAEVGRLAAEHLLENGHTRFGFVGSRSALYSEVRQRGYTERLAAAGHSVSCFRVEFLYEDLATSSWKKDERQVQKWVGQLSTPVAIFACNDIAGRGLIDICRNLGLRVPEQVAILGADDDDLESLLTTPPLSSVAVPAKRVGYEAAAMLDRLMSGKSREPDRFVPPRRVVARQSTDSRATDDPIISAALRYIRVNAASEISVNHIAEAVGVGRRELERTFRRLLDCTVLAEIRRARIQRAKELLAVTDLSMSAIALQAGFSSAQRLAVVFAQVTGTSPTAYRRRVSIYR